MSSVSDWGASLIRLNNFERRGWSPRTLSNEDSPFRASLPRPGRIFTILALYFVVVIPLNFFILKLLRRGELAWFTAPIISIFFAWIFYLNSAGIYDQPQMMMTTGTLVADDRMTKAFYVGNAQMFFPTGGTFDLKLKDVESFRDLTTTRSRGPFGQMSGTVVERLDVGQIVVPVVSLPSFSFREFAFSQSMVSDRMLILKISGVNRISSGTRGKNSPATAKVVGTLINRSKLELNEATLNLGSGLKIGSIHPGEQKQFSGEVQIKSRDAKDNPGHASPLVMLRAKIGNKRFGPEFGKVDLGRNMDDLEYTFNHIIPEELQ